SRELYWPPTDDERWVWLIKYTYIGDEEDEEGREPSTEIGMVGSITFSLFSESTVDMTVEELYGLHCAWELEVRDDPRAPKQRTAEAGCEILREYNDGF